jgi:hypothetical protein
MRWALHLLMHFIWRYFLGNGLRGVGLGLFDSWIRERACGFVHNFYILASERREI